jgi:tetratricopeptide (TPR) repeat protein
MSIDRSIMRWTARLLPAGFAVLVAGPGLAQDFQWSWEKSGSSAQPPAATGTAAFTWGWQTSGAARAVEPARQPDPGQGERRSVAPGTVPGSVDAAAYNDLLRDNLDLRRRLSDAAATESRLGRENDRLSSEVRALEGQISKLVASIQDLKQKEPSGTVTSDMESRLAALEAEKKRLQDSLATIAREAEERRRAAVSAPAAAASPVEPGSDLFRRTERENLELREKLARIEAENKRTSDANAKIAGDEAKARTAFEELSSREKALRDELAAANTAAREQERKSRELAERLPKVESDLAARTKDAEEKGSVIAERDRQIKALQEELRRRDSRVSSVERTATLMEQAKREVEAVSVRERRDMHFNMGVMYARGGKYRSAEREYLKALEIDPGDPDVHYNLGILYDDNLGDKAKAATHYRRFLMLRPHGPDAEAVRGWLTAAEIKR